MQLRELFAQQNGDDGGGGGNTSITAVVVVAPQEGMLRMTQLRCQYDDCTRPAPYRYNVTDVNHERVDVVDGKSSSSSSSNLCEVHAQRVIDEYISYAALYKEQRQQQR